MRTALVLLMSGFLLFSCGKKADTDTSSATTSDNDLLVDASNRLIAKFGKELKSELMAAMSDGGAENAISVCQLKAPEIAKANSGQYWSIVRVSDKNRNPENFADDHQMAILARFADTTGQTAAYSYEWSEQQPKIFRYYKPIMTAPLCLKCHGPIDQLEPGVKAALQEKYPDDKATGYDVDQLRGMFVVEVLWPEGKEFAEQLVADTL